MLPVILFVFEIEPNETLCLGGKFGPVKLCPPVVMLACILKGIIISYSSFAHISIYDSKPRTGGWPVARNS